LNQARVEGFIYQGATIEGVRFVDRVTGATHEVRAPMVINAAGVWIDGVRALDRPHPPALKPTKGVHLVIPRTRIRQHTTVAFSFRRDRRLLFSIPWGAVTIVGTTDTFSVDRPEDLRTTLDDFHYIVDAVADIFPAVTLTPEDVISSYAGLRPLIAPPDVKSAGEVSREHHIFEDPSGLVSIAGGKLTTYRLMAAEVLDVALKRLPPQRRAALQPCATDAPLTGQIIDVPVEIERLRARGLPLITASHLVSTYGSGVDEVLEHCDALEGGWRALRPGFGFLRGEVGFAVRRELALHLTDVLARRMRFALWVPGQGLDIAEDVAGIMGDILGWDEEERRAEVDAYRREVQRVYRPDFGVSRNASAEP